MKDVPGTKYIIRTPEGNYRIAKKINGETVQFGVYQKLETAIYYRDYFQNKGWSNCLHERTKYTDTKRAPVMKYIRKSGNNYRIDKDINNKKYNFGTYDTLDEAIFFRDYFQENSWPLDERLKYTNLPAYISGNQERGWDVRKTIDGECIHFGRYHTLKEAIKWRDYFIKNNWNIDLRLMGTPNKNIYYKLGKYRIIKKIDGVEYHFGSFNTLTEAEKRVDEIKLKGWRNVLRDNERLIETTVKNIIKLPNGKYEIIKIINGVRHTFGVFNTYEEAAEEVKLLRKCNWDYDALCESIDETNDGDVVWLNRNM